MKLSQYNEWRAALISHYTTLYPGTESYLTPMLSSIDSAVTSYKSYIDTGLKSKIEGLIFATFSYLILNDYVQITEVNMAGGLPADVDLMKRINWATANLPDINSAYTYDDLLFTYTANGSITSFISGLTSYQASDIANLEGIYNGVTAKTNTRANYHLYCYNAHIPMPKIITVKPPEGKTSVEATADKLALIFNTVAVETAFGFTLQKIYNGSIRILP